MQTYCQSCGMPLVDAKLLATEKDGQVCQDYCTYCYELGEFKQPNITVNEMINICVPHLKEEGMAEEEARQMLASFLPSLKRWRAGDVNPPVVQEKQSFQIVGIEARTNNANEITPTAKIPQLWTSYFQQNVAGQLLNQVNEGVMYGLYSDYETDVNGDYSITLGVEVSTDKEVPNGMSVKTIPASKYLVFTSEKGSMPEIVIKAWQEIWAWFANSDVERTYTGDFEIYDERCQPNESQVDIYIAIK
ncbi:effector binding domain-containing protein [Lysinibacillus sp. NPDC093712]|uniref:effector binding domain-containing protein n=1 Tax=Lysinibacillus sp. NPDC093712 TaxID=3390579 RepID=UPI003D003EF2